MVVTSTAERAGDGKATARRPKMSSQKFLVYTVSVPVAICRLSQAMFTRVLHNLHLEVQDTHHLLFQIV